MFSNDNVIWVLGIILLIAMFVGMVMKYGV